MTTIDNKINCLKMMGYKVTIFNGKIIVALEEFWIVKPIEDLEKDFIIEEIVKKINEMIIAESKIKNSKFYKIINNTDYGDEK